MRASGHRRTAVLAWLAATALVTATVGAITGGSTAQAASPGAEPEWNVLCSIDHFAPDDPIVYPNQPGKAHMHAFFGNPTTSAATTPDSLMASPSTCGRDMQTSDRSAYWVPALYKKNADGTSTRVSSSQGVVVYYRRAGGPEGPKVKPFPIGLRMIAGDMHATAANPQPLSIVEWDCARGGPQTAYIPSCPDPNQPIHVNVVFPNCWDGKHLDSADHTSHMAYSAANGTCPSGHPVSLPKVTVEVDWEGNTGGPAYSLASGGVYSMHADFFAGWDSRVQNALVETCLNGWNDCANISRDGDTLFRPESDPDPITIDLTKFKASPPFVDTPWPSSSPASSPPMDSSMPMDPPTSTTAPAASVGEPTEAVSPTAAPAAPRRHHRRHWYDWLWP